MTPTRTGQFLFALLTIIAVLAYLPGLDGDFLFDDFANLPALGAFGPVDNATTFWRYITSGTADPTGRPLALLSFLVDARNWPAEPHPFKRTNLLLHLLNGLLLWRLLRTLGFAAARTTHDAADTHERRVELAAALGSGLWVLHPLLVSTTLYIVQREAMLPATCVLLGLLAWLRGRSHFTAGRPHRGAFWMATGIAGGTALGIASKANGALLPLYVLLIEALLLRRAQPLPAPTQQVYARWLILLAAVPALLLLIYLGKSAWHSFELGAELPRPWTLDQRLLTQPAVLLKYLSLLWLPRPFTTGLFNDQVMAAQGLWEPPETALWIAATLAMLAFATAWRRRWLLVSLALWFFFTAHLMESTVIPLELYYEHRNYIPAMLLFWPLSWWLCDPDVSLRRCRFALTLFIVVGLALMTHARASLWGKTEQQAALWAHINPDSPRAIANAALNELGHGRPGAAEVRLSAALERFPSEVQIALNLVTARCMLGNLDATTVDKAATSLRTTQRIGPLFTRWFERSMPIAAPNKCPGLSLSKMGGLIDAAQDNPKAAQHLGYIQDLHYLRGIVALYRGDGESALTAFNHSLGIRTHASVAMRHAAMLGSAGFASEGLKHLNHHESLQEENNNQPGWGMPLIHARLLQRQGYWHDEESRLRAALQKDVLLESAPAEKPSP